MIICKKDAENRDAADVSISHGTFPSSFNYGKSQEIMKIIPSFTQNKDAILQHIANTCKYKSLYRSG
jgi:hypothetical protein